MVDDMLEGKIMEQAGGEMERAPVRFRLGVEYGAVREEVRAALLLMDQGINVIEQLPLEALGYEIWVCETGQACYEGLFGAELEYAPRVVHNLNKGDYIVWDWREKTPALVPKQLEGLVQYVELERKICLTD